MKGMPDRQQIEFGWRARHLRVETQVRLRWLAIAGQLAAVLFVHFGLRFALPLMACLSLIVASATLNLALRLTFPRTHRLADGPAAASLAFDIAQLAALLSLTGGIENPFTILLLAPVMIGAVSLPRHLTLMLLALMIGVALMLTRFHMPLPWQGGELFTLPPLYRIGLWVALGSGGAFVGMYASRVSEEARRLSDALAATELAVLREQHLTQIDGLAAAAAHELGTPLATITLVVKDLLQHPERPASREDIETLAQQTARCRQILRTLTSLGSENDGVFDAMTLGVLIEEVVAPHRDFGVGVDVDLSGSAPEPRCRRSPTLLYGLGNLIENAVDFATTTVTIHANWTATNVSILIADDGAGFEPDILTQAGEPYISRRSGDRRAKGDEGGGLGLGLFIAKTLLEKSGATLTLENAPSPAQGARVAIRWPRRAFEENAPLVRTASAASEARRIGSEAA